MRVKPAEGLVLRDPRTKQLVDPVQGVEVDEHDFNFRWLLDHDDAVEMTADEIAAADRAADAPPPPAPVVEAVPHEAAPHEEVDQ